MRMTARKMLGLALEENALLVAEVSASGDGAEVSRTAEFRFPEDLSLDDSEQLGAALAEFLHGQGFTARQAVLGLPAKWLVAKRKKMPPTGNRSVAAVLRLQAEREFSLPADQLMMDFLDTGDASQARWVLLVAAQRVRAQQAAALARAAGLKVKALSSSVLALSAASRNGVATDRCVVHLAPGSAELSVETGGQCRMVRHLSLDAESDAGGAELVGRLRRALALMPQDGGPTAAKRIDLWDSTGELATPLAAQDAGSLRVRSAEGLGGLGISDDAHAGRFAAPVALALGGADADDDFVDFANSHLAPRKSNLPRRRVMWAAGVGAGLLLIALVLGLQLRANAAEVARMDGSLSAMQPRIEEAQALIDKVTGARDWYDTSPKFVRCMRELALSFPEEGTVWTTSVVIQSDLRSAIVGKAVNEQTVYGVLDRLKQNPSIAGVKLNYVRKEAANGGTVSFALSFAFVGME